MTSLSSEVCTELMFATARFKAEMFLAIVEVSSEMLSSIAEVI